jgi:hypothetical protein
MMIKYFCEPGTCEVLFFTGFALAMSCEKNGSVGRDPSVLIYFPCAAKGGAVQDLGCLAAAEFAGQHRSCACWRVS